MTKKKGNGNTMTNGMLNPQRLTDPQRAMRPCPPNGYISYSKQHCKIGVVTEGSNDLRALPAKAPPSLLVVVGVASVAWAQDVEKNWVQTAFSTLFAPDLWRGRAIIDAHPGA